ncbi:MAG: hypothetical protein E7171_08685 [Firmicutes bacterium]|nr:hypothetical protein [Bacillota bacterium]
MFTKEKVIDKERIKEAIIEKKSMTFEKLEETIVKELLILENELKEEGIIDSQKENEEVNIYEYYINYFSTLLFGLTLDELEFINDNNLFEFDRNNLLDCRCQLILDERIKNFKSTIDDLSHGISIENIGNYFQKFGDIRNQSKQGTKLTIILGLDRKDIELTPLGCKLKSCIDNIKNIHINFLRQNKASAPKR